jgi:esterase/lipase superfamily enzyme
MYWMITNRNVETSGFGDEFSNLSFWTNPTHGPVDVFASWQPLADLAALRDAIVRIASAFPDPLTTPPENQKHVTFFIHGYNERWDAAARLYGTVVDNLFSGANSLGECILFSWPSEGSTLGYLPDRSEARQSGEDFADVLSELYDWLALNQQIAAADPSKACRAQTSVICHSMGNYLLENAMNIAWTRKNRPLLVSLINQLLMVAADVDNDIFSAGDSVKKGDGEGIANLSYRVSALYSGRDSVLGISAGMKHFGKRRLGRSGLDATCPVPDNVWDIDCSSLIPDRFNGLQVHSAYFDPTGNCYDLMRALLQGVDRSVLIGRGVVPQALAKTQTQGAG